MIRKYFPIIMLGMITINGSLKAQNNISTSLPDIKPPTAETYKISTYGLDFNNSPSGEFKHNFPIYNVGQSINLPISLSYNSGVKVDDIGSSIGISWQLISGGAISRIVRDEPDEMSSSVWFPNTIDVNADVNKIRGAAHPDNSIDTEYDWFSFSLSNGLSGEFYIDRNLNVYYNGGDGAKLSIKDKTTIVTQYGKQLEFTLIDNQGNTYYFGGEDKFMERTRINYKGPDKYYTSGWYLKKIVTNRNEVINYDYTIEQTEYYASMGASFTVSENCCVPNTYENSGMTKNNTTIMSLKPRILTIDDDIVKINFSYDKPRKDLITGNGWLLTSIDVLSKQSNQVIKNYLLSYDDINSGSAVTYYGLSSNEQSTVNRHFLKDINETKFNQKFKFDYYSKESIPPRFSLSTDLYGYSNGKSNLTPFPNVSKELAPFIYNKTYGWASADKEVSPDRTYLGNLKRIYYPTGGYSEITYESNSSTAVIEVEKSEGTGLQASRNCKGPKTVSKKFTFTSNGSPITYFATAKTNYLDCGEPDFHEVHGISITDLTTGQNVRGDNNDYNIPLLSKNCVTELPTDNACPVNTISGHVYEVEYFVSSYLGRIDGFASVDYNSRKELQTVLKHFGGSRVLKIEENSTENGSYTKWFYYNKLIDRTSLYTSIANANSSITYDFLVTKRNCFLECNPGNNTGNPPLVSSSIPAYRFYKDNILSDYNDRSNKIFYKSITELVDNNKAIERNYLYIGDSKAYLYSPPVLDAPHSNSGQIKRGLLENETQYRFHNNDFVVFKVTDNKYSSQQNMVTSFIFKENFQLSTGYVYNPQDGPIPNISYTFYQNYYGFSKLIESTSREYIGGQILETKSNTMYGNPQHWQPTIRKIIFPDSSISETSYQYANEKGNQKLINANMEGIPLETAVISKKSPNDSGEVISRTETKYDDPANLFPTSVLSFDLQNVLSTEVTYDKYDSKGNIQQYTSKDGISTVIIWGYGKTLPIARIVGAKLSNINQSLIDNIINVSQTDGAQGTVVSEEAMQSALDEFRNNQTLSSYQITTYSHDPLVGVKSITPPSGIREFYVYDTAGRLKEVREQNNTGKILKEFNYHYKN